MLNRKFVAAMLTLTMIAGCVPATVLADDITEEITEETSEAPVDEGPAAVTEEAPADVEPETAENESEANAVVYKDGNGQDTPDNAVHVQSAADFGTLDSDGCYVLSSDKTYILDNSVVTNGRIVTRGATVTIDLNKKTISRGLTDPVEGGGVFGVEDGSSLTVTNGKVTGGARAGNGGGFNVEGTLRLNNVRVSGNKATEAGGGIFVSGTNATVILEGNTEVTFNEAGTEGGGIYVNEGSLKIKGNPQVLNNQVYDRKCNVYLTAGHKIEVTGSLGETTRIGVTHYDEGKNAFTRDYGMYSHTGDPETMFFGDGSNVASYRNGEVWSAYECIIRSWNSTKKEVEEDPITVYKFISFDDLDRSADGTIDLTDDDGWDNWYVVNRDKKYEDTVVRCVGEANILLCNGQTLTCEKGILVEEGNTLNIIGQAGNTGRIVTTGGFESAGIGGGNETSTGVINIHGGTIVAEGGDYAAGIGGGDQTTCGTVTIFGGDVNAEGGVQASGIGCGHNSYDLGTIKIHGGKITARGYMSAGIGSTQRDWIGDDLNSGVIEITGGTISAQGGYAAAGIGGALGRNCNMDISISGGDITAKAGNSAAGIGAGPASPYFGGGDFTGKIVISGGSVAVSSSFGHPRIGAGYPGGENGTLEIADDLCVYYDDSDPVAAADRVSTCQADSNKISDIMLHIAPCTHVPDTYTVLNDTQHRYQCKYCNSVITEDHDYVDGVCSGCGHSCMGVRLAGYSLSLEGDIAVNYYMELTDDALSSSTAHMHFDLPGGASDDVYVDKAEIKTLGGKTYHVFKCRVAAKYVNSEIKAYMVDGSMSSTEYKFTIKEYADYLIERTSGDSGLAGATKDLARALVNYGLHAQKYFGIKSDLEPQSVDSVVVAKRFAYDSTQTSLPSTVTLAGASLSLKSETTMSIYLDTALDLHDVTCVDQDGNTYQFVQDDNGKYTVVRVRDLAVTDLDNILTISFKAGDDDTVYHVSYCPLTYCYNVTHGAYDAKLTNACKALYKYWDEAETYLVYKELGI